MVKFVTKEGWLTEYSMACGNMEVNAGWKQKRIASLEKDSACYHVKGYDENESRNYWESFLTLTEARKDYLKQLRQRDAKRTINR